MPDVPIRVRHPRGVTTLELDPTTTTLADLRVLVFSATEIPPSHQDIKYGYPPKPLPISSPTDTLSVVPISRGEQLIITSNPDAANAAADTVAAAPAAAATQLAASTVTPTDPSSSAASPAAFAPSPTPAPSVKALNAALSAPSPLTPTVAVPSPSPFVPAPSGGSAGAGAGGHDEISEEDARAIAEAAASFDSPPPGPSAGVGASGTTGSKTDSVRLPGRDAGELTLRVVPDDNSCLFSAIGVVFEGGMDAGQRLRKVVADEIRRDGETWSDVMLGQSRESYIAKISDKNTWGGAIELSVFAKHYKTEISSFDVATGRCDRFGEGEYETRCILAYSGIHYDAITLSPAPDAPPEFHTTLFEISDAAVFTAAEQLVAQLKARHYYTDTATFDLRCGVCGEGLVGEKGAREHAMRTGHVEFGEY